MDIADILITRLEQLLTEFIRVLPQFGIALVVIAITWLVANSRDGSSCGF